MNMLCNPLWVKRDELLGLALYLAADDLIGLRSQRLSNHSPVFQKAL